MTTNLNPNQNLARHLRLSTTIDELLQLKAITRRTYNGCKSYGFQTLGSMLTLTSDEIMRWRGCGRKVWSELRSLIEMVKFQNNETFDESMLSENDLQDIPPSVQAIQKELYCFGIISQAIAILRDVDNKNRVTLNDIHSLSSCLSSYGEIEETHLPKVINEVLDNMGGRAYQSIIAMNEPELSSLSIKIKALSNGIFRLIETSKITSECLSVFEQIANAISLKYKFPFLSDKEIDFCVKFQSKNHNLPKIFILHKSLIRSKSPQAQMLCYRYGLYVDGETRTLEEIAEMFDLTRERVRQLTDADGNALKKVSPNGLIDENDFSEIQFLSEDDAIISDLLESQNLTINRRQLIILIDILSKRLGSSSFTKNGRSYLFSWNLWNKVNFMRVDSFVKDNMPSKRTEDIEIGLDSIIDYSVVNIHEGEKEVMRLIISNYLSDTHHLYLNENNNYFLEQNHVSYGEILEIVADKDAIITKEEILAECESRFPGLKFNVFDISQNPYLSAVGLKGYVPKSERARYFSSIGDCAEAILLDAGRPMSASDLLEEVLEKGCLTNLNSLRSLLSRKEESRFVRFVGDLWGLSCIDYDNVSARLAIVVKRKTFHEHFEELKRFVALNKRIPANTNADDESNLARWINNVRNENLTVSENEKATLEAFLKENRDLPQDSLEFRFQQNCITYKKVVSFLRKRPSPQSRPQLCNWFDSSLVKKDSMSSNCRRYFEDLLEWLEMEGVYFG